MTFPFNAYLVTALSGFCTTLLSLPLWRRWCLWVGLVDEPGERKIHAHPVPLAGGLAVITGLLLPTLAAACIFWYQGRVSSSAIGSDAASSQVSGMLAPLDGSAAFLLQYGLSRRATRLAGIFAGALGILIVGWLDDRFELRPRTKFAGQVCVAGLVAACGVRVTLFVPNVVFHYAITIVWIVTLLNAFNFMDNMNGLCAGLGAISSWYFAMIAAGNGQYLVAITAFLAFGALAGFLPYNFPNARAFLGDSGSHLVGYLLAVLAILPHFYTVRHPRHWAVLIPLLVLAVPLFDMVQVVLVRWHLGKPFYHGDTNHLSHRLVQCGLSKVRAVEVLWLAAALIAALGLLLD